jgi:hypothetical protein
VAETQPELARITYEGPSTAVTQLVRMLRNGGFAVDRRNQTAQMERRGAQPEYVQLAILVGKGGLVGTGSFGAQATLKAIVKRFNDRNKPWNAKAEVEDSGDI